MSVVQGTLLAGAGLGLSVAKAFVEAHHQRIWVDDAPGGGARVAGTVLFAVHTVGVLGVVTSSQAGLGPAKVLTLIGWLIALGAVMALWQPPSSAFFTAQASLNR